ncbi:MAG: hypothetical protein IGS48_09180 [Oscillatoriales cyanobacterium C42_A2020_001]|nr:hypothetical protein [Leptolyngbyaceae cyanobacterium C42_A2020_001]
MRCPFFVAIAPITSLISIGIAGISPGYAEGIQFACVPAGYQFNQPTTVIHTPYGKNLPLITWATPEFRKWNHEPGTRCAAVSQRLQQYYNCDLLNPRYIGAATVPWTENGQTTFYPSVVVVHDNPTPCAATLPANILPSNAGTKGYVGLLFMLPPEGNAYSAAAKMRQILNQLDDLRFTAIDVIEN